MAILEYLPVENIWNSVIFIKAFVKSGSCSIDLKISFIPKICFFYLQSSFLDALCLHDLILKYFIVWFLPTLACEFWFIYNLLWPCFHMTHSDSKWTWRRCIELSEATLFVTKKEKSRQFMYEIFVNHQCKSVKVLQSPIWKSISAFSAAPCLSKILSTPRISKMVKKQIFY